MDLDGIWRGLIYMIPVSKYKPNIMAYFLLLWPHFIRFISSLTVDPDQDPNSQEAFFYDFI